MGYRGTGAPRRRTPSAPALETAGALAGWVGRRPLCDDLDLCDSTYSMTFYSMTFYSMTFYSMTFYSMTFYSMTFYSMTFYSMTFYSMTFYSMTFFSTTACWLL